MNKALNVKYKILKYALWSAGGVLVVLFFVLILFIFYSFCYKRICEKCGKQPGAIRMAQSRALTRLRDHFREVYR